MNMNTQLYTFDGGTITPFNPVPSEINFDDIARGLAYRCRWGGQVRQFYSVAEHSIQVADQCTDEFKLWALLHDAAEAYLGDIPEPIKNKVWFHVPAQDGVIVRRPYLDVEIQIRNLILAAAGCVVVNTPDMVHDADMIIRRWEHRELVCPHTRDQSIYLPMQPDDAMGAWLQHFDRLRAAEHFAQMDQYAAGVA